jgi:hypothetical protein
VTPQGTGPHGKQTYGTPPAFLNAVWARFGAVGWDLAATYENSVATDFISPERNSLETPWPIYRSPRHPNEPVQMWLNPPFADIAPWAKKCAEWVTGMAVPGSRIFMLVPAAVGTNWWRDYVSGKARVIAVSPRLTFVGCKDPFPKDCALCVYEVSWPEQPRIVEPWRWDAENSGGCMTTMKCPKCQRVPPNSHFGSSKYDERA